MENDITMKTSETAFTRSRDLEAQTLSRRLAVSTADVKKEKVEKMILQMQVRNFEKLVPESILENFQPIMKCYILMVEIDKKAQINIDILSSIVNKKENNFDETSHYILQYLFELQALMRSVYVYISKTDNTAIDFNALVQRLLPAQRQANEALLELFYSLSSEGSSPLRTSSEYMQCKTAHETLAGICSRILFNENDDLKIKSPECARTIETEFIQAHGKVYECLCLWIVRVINHKKFSDVHNESGKIELAVIFENMVKIARGAVLFRKENFDEKVMADIRIVMMSCSPDLLSLIDSIQRTNGELDDSENLDARQNIRELSDVLHEKISPISTMIPSDHTIGQEGDGGSFSYKDFSTLETIIAKTHEELSASKELEKSLQEIKGTLSKRIKEVYSTQKKLDASLLQQKLLDKKNVELLALLDEKEKQRLTIQADFEKEQLNFESAISEIHKDVENLQRENRRLKKRPDVLPAASPGGNPQTESSQRASTTPYALHYAVSESHRWRKLFFEEKMRSSPTIELKRKPSTARAKKIRSLASHLVNVNATIRLRQSSRRLLDLTSNQSLETELYQSRSLDTKIVSDFEKCKQEVTYFVAEHRTPRSFSSVDFVEAC